MKIKKKIVLNLGCGKTKIPNSIGVDVKKIRGFVDVVHDLNLVPYPFEDSTADEIHLYHVLEHLDNPVQIVEELCRILKPRGSLHIRVPHFSSLGAFTDMTHRRPFGYLSFDIFDPNHPQHYYTSSKMIVCHKEIKYFGLYPNSGIYEKYVHPNQCNLVLKPFVILINFFIALSPILFERIWCYWVGGACELVVHLKKLS